MPELWFGLLTIGFLAGILSGMFGIGGGVVIVPALTVFLGFQTVEAISTSLAALLMPVGIFAVVAYYRAGLLSLRSSGLIAIGLLVTSWLGAEIALSLPADTLRQLYGVFLLTMSWRFVEPRKTYSEWQARYSTPSGNKTENGLGMPPATSQSPGYQEAHWSILLLVGLIAGVASGMFGIGGGAIIVPALVGFFDYDQKQAVGTSLGALLLPVGLPGVLRYADEGVLDLPVAILVAVGLVFGAIFGAKIALNLPSRTVKQLYGVFLIFVAMRFIFQ
jgi:uncharacterized membrane protein YfcA